MSVKNEERGVRAALGQIPQVNNQKSFNATITVAGTGLGDITIDDVRDALIAQHKIVSSVPGTTVDQMYVHAIRAYGTAGGYLSIAPYPHRQYLARTNGSVDFWINSYSPGTAEFRSGSLQQMYDFGINGATRPELKFNFPGDEVINNPFSISVNVEDIENEGVTLRQTSNQCKLLTIQSTNVNGDALYIVQFDVTVRNSNFISITTSLGGAAFGEKNVLTENYKPSNDLEKRLEEGEKAQEMANKKRKVESVKALTMPALDAH